MNWKDNDPEVTAMHVTIVLIIVAFISIGFAIVMASQSYP